jgi:hypothetical protein
VWPDETTTVVPTPSAPILAIAYGQTMTETLEEFGEDKWVFDGAAGDIVTIAAMSSEDANMDTSLELFGPEGESLFYNDDDGPGLNPLIDHYTLPATGAYTIRIDAFSGSGSYQLTLTKN